jgi:hypothetical protein
MPRNGGRIRGVAVGVDHPRRGMVRSGAIQGRNSEKASLRPSGVEFAVSKGHIVFNTGAIQIGHRICSRTAHRQNGRDKARPLSSVATRMVSIRRASPPDGRHFSTRSGRVGRDQSNCERRRKGEARPGQVLTRGWCS